MLLILMQSLSSNLLFNYGPGRIPHDDFPHSLKTFYIFSYDYSKMHRKITSVNSLYWIKY